MKRLLLLLLLILPVQAWATTYYASNDGAGDGSSAVKPFTLQAFFALPPQPDDICVLLDGTYQGANNMIDPPNGLSGTSGHPITIQAQNDGAVLIDGQGARIPIYLATDNDYWIIEGVNAKDSSGAVVSVGRRSDYNTIRRVCAWDTPGNVNSAVFVNHGDPDGNPPYDVNVGNLFEDVCGFGRGRKIISSSQRGNEVTYRRGFFMWNYYAGSPGNLGVGSSYKNYTHTVENCIMTWNRDPTSPWPQSNNFGIAATEQNNIGEDSNEMDARWLGNIIYVPNSHTYALTAGGAIRSSQYVDDIQWINNVVFLDTNFTDATAHKTAYLYNAAGTAGIPTGAWDKNYFTNNTEIGGGGRVQGNQWIATDNVQGATVAAVPNIWNGAGTTGARVCYQYQDRTLTGTKLWPWPMNQRIIDALTLAGRTPIDVTATMQSIFGAIPAACRTDIADPPDPPELTYSAQWLMENGALNTDSSGNDNTTANAFGTPTANTDENYEGVSSVYLDGGDAMAIADASLSAGFPTKSSGGGVDFSVFLRFKVTDSTATSALVSKFDQGADQRSWFIRLGSDNRLDLYRGITNGTDTSVADLFAAGTVLDNTEYALGISYDDSSGIAYGWLKNKSTGVVTTGSEDLTDNAISLTAAPLCIGCSYNSGSTVNRFTGYIDQVLIADAVWDADDFAALEAGAQPVVISDITETAISTNSARITWTTDAGADSQICWGLVSGTHGTCTTPNEDLVTSHSVIVTGLPRDDQIFYVVISGATTSAEGDFNTLDSPRDFYFDITNGLDTNSGSVDSPWQTTGQLNGSTLVPDDRLIFLGGGDWSADDAIVVPNAGTDGHTIDFLGDGSGADPILPAVTCAQNYVTFTDLRFAGLGTFSGTNITVTRPWFDAGATFSGASFLLQTCVGKGGPLTISAGATGGVIQNCTIYGQDVIADEDVTITNTAVGR